MVQYLYIIDYWVPFPQSEYGGLINVIAEDDAECYNILYSEEQFDENYKHSILPAIHKSEKLELKGVGYESGIIDAFLT